MCLLWLTGRICDRATQLRGIGGAADGFGAFVAFYLADLKWSQVSVGFALTIGRFDAAFGVIPGGAWPMAYAGSAVTD
jgi:hypothetical protein